MHIYNAFSYLTVDFSKVTRARNKMARIHVVVHTFKLTIHPYQYKKKNTEDLAQVSHKSALISLR